MSAQKEILEYLTKLKKELEREGLLILGLFGSQATNLAREDSDIDVLIDSSDDFIQKYPGFEYFIKLEKIRQKISIHFHKQVDIVDKSALKNFIQTAIAKEILYV